MDDLASQGNPQLFVDAGGLYPRTNIENRMDGPLVYTRNMESLKAAGVDALVLGGLEFRMGTQELKAAILKTDVPMLSSNLVYKGTTEPYLREAVVKQIGDAKVAIFGILSDSFLWEGLQMDAGEYLTLLDPVQTLQRLVAQYRDKVDYIVVLTQAGFAMAEDFSAKVPGVDLFVTSGSDSADPISCSDTFIDPKRGVRVSEAARVVEPTPELRFMTYAVLDKQATPPATLAAVNSTYLAFEMELDPELAKVVGDDVWAEYNKERQRKQLEERQAAQDELKAVQQMTPEEYIEYITRQNSAKEDAQ